MSSSKIKKALRDSDLSTALSLLSSRITDISNYDLREKFGSIDETYRTMLTYMLQGLSDEGYVDRRDNLRQSMFELNDQIDRFQRLTSTDRQSRYGSAQRGVQAYTFEQIVMRLEADLTDEEHDRVTCNLFNYVWTSDIWKKADYELATNILNSDLISDNDKAVFVSALTLALNEMFDKRKLNALFDAYLAPSGIINQRALVGIILAVKMYDSRLECFSEIRSRLNLYADDPRFVKEVYYALLMLQFACISDKVSNKMVNDIFPSLMSGGSQMSKLSPSELKSKLTVNGENPDWIDKKMEKGINAMNELVAEGADIHLSSFRYMKGYPFFNQLPHWFYPFDIKSPYLSDMDDIMKGPMGKMIQQTINTAMFCNSDLYSFCLMIGSVSSKEKLSIQSQLENQLPEEMLDEVASKTNGTPMSNKDICRNYIFDIYRFFFLYPFYNQFNNPFKLKRRNADGTEVELSYSPVETKSFDFLLNEKYELQNLAEFFMRKGFYEKALKMYDIVDPQQIEDDANVWQKIGFCKQKLGKEKSALKTYILADSLHPDSTWTMTHIAQLAQKLEVFDTAIDYYDLLLQQDEGNIRHIVNKAICQMKLHQFDKAVTTLFKAHYLDEYSLDIRQMMAECYAMCGELDKSENMIESVIHEEKCSIETRILYALITMKKKSAESAYYCVREAMSVYDSMDKDSTTFTEHYNSALAKYSEAMQINRNMAHMILDSAKLDIR